VGITLAGAGSTKSFKNVELAAEWLLAQAGVQKLSINKQAHGIWALCEVRVDGSRQVLVEVRDCNGASISSLLLRKFCDDWSRALGFERIVPQDQSLSWKGPRRSRVPDYMRNEAAHIAAFGY